MRKIYSLLATALLLLGSVSAWAADVIETVGATDCSTTFFGATSQTYTMTGNGTYHFVFTNHNSGTGSNWDNWLFSLRNGSGTEYVCLRADYFGWGNLYNENNRWADIDWTNYVANMNGATVDMTIVRNGKTVTMNTTTTQSDGNTAHWNYTTTEGVISDDIQMVLSVEKAYLEITTAEQSATADPITSTLSFIDPTTTINAGLTIANAATTNSYGVVTYESSNTAVATVDANGNVTGVAEGTATITAHLAANAAFTAAEDASYDVTIAAPDPNWSINFSEIGSTYSLADKDAATISDAVADGLGTVTLGTQLDSRFGLAAGSSWIYRTKSKGLYSFNGSGKPFGVFNAKEGQLIVVNIDIAPSAVSNAELVLTDGNQRVYKVTADGNVKFTVSRYCTIYSITVSDNLYTYTAKTNVGDLTLGSGVCNNGDQVTVAYPRYINVDGTLYQKDATGKTYQVTFTPDADNYEYVVEYKATDITNVVYFSEAENIAGATATSAGNNMAARSSNAQCGYAASDITLVNLPAGAYCVKSVQYANSSAGLTLKYQVGDETIENNNTTSSNWYEFTNVLNLTSDADFTWLTSGDSKNCLDFIYIQKVTSVPATIGAAGYATFVSDYNTKPADGVTAYAVKVNGETATLTEVNAIPAKAAVVLKGAEGTYNMTVTSTADALENNDLIYSTSAVTADGTQYILANGTQGVGFYEATTSTTISANKGYLVITDANAAKALTFAFAGDATAINSVNVNANSDAIYNVSGQKVNNSFKGIVIKNGKKYLNK